MGLEPVLFPLRIVCPTPLMVWTNFQLTLEKLKGLVLESLETLLRTSR